jgi:hypothetical protein
VESVRAGVFAIVESVSFSNRSNLIRLCS